MNTIDVMIGFLIGIFAERFLKLTVALQKLIAQAKEAKKKEAARKKALLEKKDAS